MELWLNIVVDGICIFDYEVSNEGKIRNVKTGRILKPYLNRPDGYLRVDFYGRHHYIHRLVADRFLGGNHDGMKVVHIDGDKANNHLSNLRWID